MRLRIKTKLERTLILSVRVALSKRLRGGPSKVRTPALPSAEFPYLVTSQIRAKLWGDHEG